MNYSLLNFKGSTAANAIRYSVIDNGTDNQIVSSTQKAINALTFAIF